MEKAGVDAILAASPANVFYVSDYYSVGMSLGCGTQGYALLPLDAEPALMAPLAEADLVAESRSWIKDIHWYGCLKVNTTGNPKASDITQAIIEATKAKAEQTPCDSLVIAATSRGLAKKTIAVDGQGVNPTRWENIKAQPPRRQDSRRLSSPPGDKGRKDLRGDRAHQEGRRGHGEVDGGRPRD